MTFIKTIFFFLSVRFGVIAKGWFLVKLQTIEYWRILKNSQSELISDFCFCLVFSFCTGEPYRFYIGQSTVANTIFYMISTGFENHDVSNFWRYPAFEQRREIEKRILNMHSSFLFFFAPFRRIKKKPCRLHLQGHFRIFLILCLYWNSM